MSSCSVNRVGEKDNFQIFFTFLKRLKILNEDKIFPIEIGIFEREIWKNIRLLGSLRTLCTRSVKRTTLEFFHFPERLTIVNEGRISSNEKLVYFREKYGVI